jgi:serine/threonine protein kinase
MDSKDASSRGDESTIRQPAASTEPLGRAEAPTEGRAEAPTERRELPESVLGRLRLRPVSVIKAPPDGKPPPPDRRYVIVKPIARGGMGSVLEVYDRNLRRSVAMKVLRKELRSHREWLARFLEEAHITGGLEHPGIVPVHELGISSGGHLYFTMKKVEGLSLEQVISRLAAGDAEIAREYPLPRRLEIFVKICDAISFAHAHGVIHRDLKPSNVMVGRFGEVLVMDWGLAKRRESRSSGEKEQETAPLRPTSLREAMGGLTQIGEVLGTPGYMAPEQAAGALNEIDERTDVYSLGALLYALLTARAPYVGEDSNQVIADTLTREITPVRELAPSTPRSLAAICEKALARYKEDRYQLVEELGDDVRRFLEGRSVLARPDPWPVKLWRLAMRHKAIAALSLALVLVIIGAGLYRRHTVRRMNARFRIEAELKEYSREVSTITLAYLEEAEEALQLVRRLITSGTVPLEPVDQLLLLFREQLVVRPEFFGISLILDDGRFWTVSRADGRTFRLERSPRLDEISYAYCDETDTLFQEDPARAESERRTLFAPWRDDWLRHSPRLDQSDLRWSDIYPLTVNRDLGITGAISFPPPRDGGSAGGLAVDLDLEGLSAALQGYLERGHLVAVIVDQQNRLIAFPRSLGDDVLFGDRFTPVYAERLLGPSARYWGTSLDHLCSGEALHYAGETPFTARCIDLSSLSSSRELKWAWRLWCFSRQ